MLRDALVRHRCGRPDRVGSRVHSRRADRRGHDRPHPPATVPRRGSPGAADEKTLRRLAEVYDPQDRGLRDIWEITVTTGRRIGEALQVRWDSGVVNRV